MLPAHSDSNVFHDRCKRLQNLPSFRSRDQDRFLGGRGIPLASGIEALTKLLAMTKYARLIAALLNNPKTCRFEDACKIAEGLGFVHKGGRGSHRVFARRDEREALNFQNRNGYIPAYQARQLIGMLEKYGDDDA